VEECQQKVDKLNNDLNVLETVKFVISEEGIKSFIVKKILKVLNSRLAFYLKKLEANCLCQFNEFFDEEIIDESSNQKSYFNFSGGERKRIDLACLFAFADIRRLQGDVNFSTVFYDELLDSSLDDKGVSLTLRVLRERFNENNESCYIITHRGPEVTTKAEHTIHVIKRNGISTVSC
jgi:Fe-S cluster assembly ATPase SufC